MQMRRLALLLGVPMVLALPAWAGGGVAGRPALSAHSMPPTAHPPASGMREFEDGTQPKVLGNTYGEWAARWVAWSEAGPVGRNAITDDSGQFCSANQPPRDVWFLAGTFGGPPVERSCSIPAGRSIFYPLLESPWIDCPGTPDEALTDAQVRDFLVSFNSAPVELASTLNGVSIISLRVLIVRAQTPVFRNVLPDNNVLDAGGACPTTLGGGRTGRRIGDGYWVMLPPLPPGNHTLTLRGANPFFETAVTYKLHVAPR